MAFNFALLYAPWDAAGWASVISDGEGTLSGPDRWPVWVLSNHDQVRHRTRYGGSERRARVAALVLLTLRGTPFLYAGEELGLEEASLRADQRIDPKAQRVAVPGEWTVEISTDHCHDGRPWDGTMAAEQAAMLRPLSTGSSKHGPA